MSDAKPLLLVDGSSYLYRAFNALPPLTTRSGEPTGALFGVLSMLHRLLDRYQPERIAVVFDARGKTFRHDLYNDYKAHRPSMPEELAAQIEPLLVTVRALGLPLLQVAGVEADDVIGTLARQAAAQDCPVVIVTGDKDMAQLVDGHITLLDSMKDTLMDATGVQEKFGVPPALIVDYLALMGDSSDNIPGVPGVGSKTAAKWLSEYGSLAGVVENAAAIKGKIGERLREHLDFLPLYRQLTEIKCDVPDVPPLAELSRTPPDTAALRELYERFEFRSWLAQLDKPQSNSVRAGFKPAPTTPTHAQSAPTPAGPELAIEIFPDIPPKKYEKITTSDELAVWLNRLQQADEFAFDTETNSLNYMQAEIVGVSFAVEAGHAAYVPLAHRYIDAPPQLDREQVLAQLKPLLEDPTKGKIGQHIKFDCHVLANHGITLNGIAHDSMLESYVLNSTATRHDMDSLAKHYLGVTTTTFADVAGRGAKQLTFDQVDVETAAKYAAEDADITLQLHNTLWRRLQAEKNLQYVYKELEIPLIPVLYAMEHLGVRVDTVLLGTQSQEITKRLAELESEAHRVAGQPFNLSSPKQLQEILFEQLKIPVTQKTPKGQPSTAEDVLAELAEQYELPRIILEHRGLAKLKSTYTDKLPQMVDPHTGRVHTSYHQAVTSTGRLSSSDPNLQNIPIRTPEGRRIRQAFIAADGYKILAADYSQIELRIMAHLSGDERLLQAFQQGEDIHRATAADVFDTPLEQVNALQRRSAKAINFGLIYGMSPFGLARQLGIDRFAAAGYVERYFARYPGVKAFMDRTRAQAHEQGYVETVDGRRLYLPQINARNAQHRQAAERTAINAPMQGTAADIIKRAMIAVFRALQAANLKTRMIMQVHDELVFEVAVDEIEQARQLIDEQMRAAGQLSVPLVVDMNVGANWEEAH